MRRTACLFLALSTACEAPLPEPVSLDAPDETGAGEPIPSGVDLAPPERGVQLSIGPFELAPYSETYWCRIALLPNDEPLDVVRLEHQASSTLHHFNIWALAVAPEEEIEGACDEIWSETNMALASPLYASQDPSFSGSFPDGVAGLLPSGQAVLMEYHALNAYGDPAMTEARLNAYAAEGPVEAYANGLFGSNTDIDLPPHSERTISKSCIAGVDMEVFAIGSHFHQQGRRFEVFSLDDEGQADALVYESTSWESPLLSIFEPMHVPAGGGFEFRCHYENETDVEIGYGPTSQDEMCMFVALYFPDAGFQLCR
jgi:hypothetical protein